MTHSINIVRDKKDLSKYFYVKYDISTSDSGEKHNNTDNVYNAAWNIAVGQSVGNPNARSVWETNELFDNHCCVIIKNDNFNDVRGTVEIGFPLANIDFKTDGISQLLCMIMGGQTDITFIKRCRALKIDIHDDIIKKYFKQPTFGISGLRNKRNNHNRPLFGGILKPKTGVSPTVLLDMVKEMVEGGVDFIKEDEILGNPAFCSLEDRVELISNYISKTNVTYTFCINSDPAYVLDRAKFVADNGGTGVHINCWSGLGVYKNIRELDLPLWIHYQKSGVEVMTHKNNAFGYSWQLLCQLASWSGIDSIHAGMLFGYSHNDETELKEVMDILWSNNVLPALSCGMNKDLVQKIYNDCGKDWMANVGGAIHSHRLGTVEGAREIREAIDKIK